MRIITLGTGAGRPSLHRNSSATLLEYEGDHLLFDCGEATQLQLMRANARWGKITAIFIGHLHGDHVNGLPGLLATLSMSERQAPLAVYGPVGIREYLDALNALKTLWVTYPLAVTEIQEAGLIHQGAHYEVSAAPLDHVITCWGFRFREYDRPGRFDVHKAETLGIPDGPERARLVRGEAAHLPDGRVIPANEIVGPKSPGRIIAYCCDTRPCESERQLADGADLLIHEATFDPALKKDANEWGHSTNVDAAEIAKDCAVKNLLLTHISQRYVDAETFHGQAAEVFPETLLASDLDVHEFPFSGFSAK